MAETPVSNDPIKQVLVIRKDLNMRKGKMIAQGSHASMALLTNNAVFKGSAINGYSMSLDLSVPTFLWLQGKFTKITVSAASEAELQDLIAKAKGAGILVFPIVDSGLTEFHGVETLTCASFGPDYASKLDPITGNQPLL